MAAGSIVVDLLMRTGAFESDTKRAEKRLAELRKEAERIGVAIGAAFAVVGTAAVALVKHSIDAADATSKLAQQTGTTVEELSALTYAAKLADVSQEELGSALVKLTKNLSEAANGSGDAAEAFKLLGINVKNSDGSLKGADKVLGELAEKFAGFEDGPEKTALALAAFGKSGASLIPLLNGGAEGLKEMREEAEKLGLIISEETGKNAEAFNDNLTKLGEAVNGVGNRIAADLLPELVNLSSQLVELTKDETVIATTADIVTASITALTEVFKALFTAVTDVGLALQSTGRLIGGTAAAIDNFRQAQNDAKDALLSGDVMGAQKIMTDGWKRSATIISEMTGDIKGSLSEVERLQAKVNGMGKPTAAQSDAGSFESGYVGSAIVKAPKKKAPRLHGSGGGGGDDPTKKVLDNKLKELERGIKREEDLMGDRNEFLDLYNEQGLLSIQSYYDAQRTIIEAATSAKIAAYGKEIDALRDYQAQAGKQTDKTAAEGKIQELIDKRSQLEQEAGKKSLVLNIKQVEAQERYKQELEALNGEVLELQGNLGKAAEIRFDQQNLSLFKRLTAEGNAEALKMLATLRQMTVAQAEFTQESKRTGEITESLHNDEERIGIARQLGAITELESLKQLGERRQDALRQMEAHVKAQEAIAEASKNPELIQNAERARLELEKLAAVADPLADKFRGIFQDSFSNAFEGFIDGSMSAKDALRSFASSVTKELTHMASQDIAEQIFGKDGPLGGIGDVFSKAIGGGKSASKSSKPTVDTSAITQSLTTLQATGVDPTTNALTRLAQAADGAAGSLGGKGADPWESGYPGSSDGGDSSGAWESGFPSSTSGGSGTAGAWESDFPTFGTASNDQSFASDTSTEKSFADFGKSATDATSSILKLAAAAGKGGGAMEQLPQLLQGVFSSLTGAMGGSGGGGGGGFWGTALNAAVSYFGGAKAGGGDVIGGRSYLVGEMGPERFVPRTTGTILPAQQAARGADQRPIQINQHFASGTSRTTVDQAAAQAGAAVRRATARTR